MDEEEAQKFGDVSWWDPSGPMAALHSMNMLRVPLIKNSLLGLPPDDVTTLDQKPHPLHGCSVLDIGCGAGLHVRYVVGQKLLLQSQSDSLLLVCCAHLARTATRTSWC